MIEMEPERSITLLDGTAATNRMPKEDQIRLKTGSLIQKLFTIKKFLLESIFCQKVKKISVINRIQSVQISTTQMRLPQIVIGQSDPLFKMD